MSNLFTVRCQGSRCQKVLGKVNEKGQLHIKSKRSGWWIEVLINDGEVKCTRPQCGTILKWTVHVAKELTKINR